MSIGQLRSPQLPQQPDQLKQSLIKAMQDPYYAESIGMTAYGAMAQLQKLVAGEKAGANQQSLQGGAQAQPTVAQQLASEAEPQPQGLSALPVPEEMYTADEGGIVGYAEGGDVKHYALGDVVLSDAEYAKLSPQEKVMYDRSRIKTAGRTTMKPFAAAADVLVGGPLNLAAKGIESGMGYWDRFGRAIGAIEPETVNEPFTMPKIGSGSATPYYDMIREQEGIDQAQAPQAQSPVAKPSPAQLTDAQKIANANATNLRARQAVGEFGIKPSVETLQGIPTTLTTKQSSSRRGSAASNLPASGIAADFSAPTINYTPMSESEMTKVADPRAEMQEYKDLIGEDPFAAKARERISGMEAENELYKKQFPWMALAEAGFGMAAGKSPFALQNIAAGGMQGLEAYGKGRKEAEDRQDKIFNAESKVYEAERAVNIAAAKHGLDSKKTSEAQRRLEQAEDRKNKLMVEEKNKTFEWNAKKAKNEYLQEEQKMKETAFHNRATETYYNKTPAEIQLIERIAADSKIPFSEAFKMVQQGKYDPKADAASEAKMADLYKEYAKPGNIAAWPKGPDGRRAPLPMNEWIRLNKTSLSGKMEVSNLEGWGNPRIVK